MLISSRRWHIPIIEPETRPRRERLHCRGNSGSASRSCIDPYTPDPLFRQVTPVGVDHSDICSNSIIAERYHLSAGILGSSGNASRHSADPFLERRKLVQEHSDVLKTCPPSRHCCPQVLPRPGFHGGHLETESSTRILCSWHLRVQPMPSRPYRPPESQVFLLE
jgi:hypothetical protein